MFHFPHAETWPMIGREEGALLLRKNKSEVLKEQHYLPINQRFVSLNEGTAVFTDSLVFVEKTTIPCAKSVPEI